MDKDILPTIKVTSFKESGKYYSEHTSPLKLEHFRIFGFELTDLIRKNDISVREYSGLSSSFGGSYYYVVEVDYGSKQDFCYFHLNGIKNE